MGHGGEFFLSGVMRGMMILWGVIALCGGCDHRVGGEVGNYGITSKKLLLCSYAYCTLLEERRHHYVFQEVKGLSLGRICNFDIQVWLSPAYNSYCD